MDKIRVMIVEDDTDWIKEMTFFLNNQDDILVVASSVSRPEALELTRVINPDVILMDINLGANKYDGIYTADEIMQFSSSKIIMLTSMSDEEIIKASFSAGAVNFLSKHRYMEIPSAIRLCMVQGNPIEILLKDYNRLKENDHLSVLTPSEKQVFSLIKSGLTNSQIEKTLFKSKNTLKNQIYTIFKKLGVSSRKEALSRINMHNLHDGNFVGNSGSPDSKKELQQKS